MLFFLESLYYMLPKFDFPCHCCIVGKSKSGKSTLLISIIYHIKQMFDKIYIFSNTNEWTEEYNDYFGEGDEDEDVVIQRWELDVFNTIIERCKKYMKEKKEKKILVVMDDISSEFYLDMMNAKKLASQLTECRHFGVSVFLSVHYLMAVLNPIIREQIQYYIVNGKQTPKAIDALIETVNYDPEEHEGLKLKQFIKKYTSFDRHAFMFIDVFEDKYQAIYVKDVE